MPDILEKPTPRYRILIVDDEPAILSSLKRELEDDYECDTALNASLARPLFANADYACLICDQRMPGETGSQFLSWVKSQHPDTSRILLTGYSDMESIVEAVNQGGILHFMNKPWEPSQLQAVVHTAVDHHRLLRENRQLQEKLKLRNAALESENRTLRATVPMESEALRPLVGLAPAMQKLKAKIGALTGSQSTVLITGESGTGKELVARALHFGSERKDKPFIALNCAALPESILESELFGHIKGAFTNANENRIGLLEAAHGGTLFLDEIGDMPLGMQAKLLRFLQEGTLTPVGSRSERKVDVRVIAATHRDLEAMAADKTFREDLFYRLHVIPLRTPPLRERAEDIPLLAEYFITKVAKKLQRHPAPLAATTAATLKRHPFPGNVRELENAIEYALNMLGAATTIEIDHLPDRIAASAPSSLESNGPDSPSLASNAYSTQAPLPMDLPLEDAVMALEKDWIERALVDCQGNISQTARKLGLSRQGLHNKLAKYGIQS
jgi:two-component system, NtrC family, response regulator HupR/HoxA